MEKQTKLDIAEMGRGYIGVIIIIILMATGVVSGMYAGDSMTFEVNLTNPVYTVVGNMSSLEGLNITFENGNISISPEINYKPDNFTLIFFDNITREVEKVIRRGGGTRIEYIDKNVTVYIPEYIDKIKEVEVPVEVEKIIDSVTFTETGYKLLHIIIGIIFGIGLGWFMMYKKKEKTAEEIMGDVGKDE